MIQTTWYAVFSDGADYRVADIIRAQRNRTSRDPPGGVVHINQTGWDSSEKCERADPSGHRQAEARPLGVRWPSLPTRWKEIVLIFFFYL